MAEPRVGFLARVEATLRAGTVLNCSQLAPGMSLPALVVPSTVALYCRGLEGGWGGAVVVAVVERGVKVGWVGRGLISSGMHGHMADGRHAAQSCMHSAAACRGCCPRRGESPRSTSRLPGRQTAGSPAWLFR